MTKITKHGSEHIYDGDRKAIDLFIDVEANAQYRKDIALDLVEEIRDEAKKVVQEKQDKIDEGEL